MKLGIMGAMVGEIMPIVDAIKSSTNWDLKTTNYAGNTYFEASKTANLTQNLTTDSGSPSIFTELLKNVPQNTQLVLAYSKVGKVYSTLTATIMIEKFKIQKLIFTGVAGGLSKNVKIGDLVLAKNTIQHDLDITGVSTTLKFGQVAMPNPDGTWNPDPIQTPCDELMLAKAKNIIFEDVDFMAKSEYHIGTIATGDIFCDKVEIKKEILEKFSFLEEDGDEVLAVEMEGASVNKVCQQMGVGCLVIRSVSDDGDGNIPEDFGDFMYKTALVSANLTLKLVAGLCGDENGNNELWYP